MGRKNILFLALLCAIRYPAQAQVTAPSFHYVGTDSATTYISDRYTPHSFFRTLLMGKNYRCVWKQPVTMPVFRLSQTDFKTGELGGGKQTKSLKLIDSKGKTWALRSLEKDVTPSLGTALQNTIVQSFMQDQISSIMPYGSLITGPLAKAAHIQAAQPSYYFVADDTALGPNRRYFANRLCMLEERDPGFDSTVTTEVVLRKIQSSTSSIVDQKALLKARLLDMLICDFDRHQGNWRWGLKDSGGLHIYHPIPRDRDWAFYYSEGLVPKAARLAALRFLVNFDEDPKYLTSLSAKAHTFDAMFLNALNAEDWQNSIMELRSSLTDSVIEQAVKNLPPSAFALIGASFIKKLKGRRDELEEGVMDYYRFLSKTVQIDGSDDAEIFSVLPSEGGFLLQVYRANEMDSSQRQKIYERRFLRSETYRVTINGLGGNDRFEVAEGVKANIRLRLNGGTGNDVYELNGNLPTEVNDTAAENNLLKNESKAKVHLR